MNTAAVLPESDSHACENASDEMTGDSYGLPASFTSTKAKRKASKNKGPSKRNKNCLPRELDPTDLENYAEEFKVSQVLNDFRSRWTILDPPEERLKVPEDGDDSGDATEDETESVSAAEKSDTPAQDMCTQLCESVVASGQSPVSTSSSTSHMHRYYQRRYDFFSRFDCGIDMGAGDEGWWSVTPELIAAHTAHEARFIVDNEEDPVVIDAFAGIGGNTIQFALAGFRVIAVELDEARLAAAKNNAAVYGVSDKITFIHGDAFVILKNWKEQPAGIGAVDLVFLSPPWGGPEYLKQLRYDFDSQSCIGGRGRELFQLARSLTPHVILYLPRQTCIDTFAHLLRLEDAETGSESEPAPGIETKPAHFSNDSFVVEQHWIRNCLKAISLYFYPK